VKEELEIELGKKSVPSHLFIGLVQLWENGMGTVGLDQGFIRKHHAASAHWWPQGRFGRSVGSADHLWALVVLCFLVVTVKWVLRSVVGVHLVLRQFSYPWSLQSL
jgi:hypothetical protein